MKRLPNDEVREFVGCQLKRIVQVFNTRLLQASLREAFQAVLCIQELVGTHQR